MSDFKAVESMLQELTEMVAPDDDIRKEVQEYVDVGEYGLALDSTAYGMIAGGRQPSGEELELFRKIARAMSLDPDAVLNEVAERTLER